MSRHYTLIFSLLIFLCILACSHLQKNSGVDRVALVKVGDQYLYKDDVEEMIPSSFNSSDSALFVNAFVERWAKDQVLLLEAKKNIPADLDIEEKVKDYEASLIRHNFENQLLSVELDSIVSDQEVELFYQKNKEQYQLEYPIMRSLFLKVPKPIPTELELNKYWGRPTGNNLVALAEYAERYAASFVVEDSLWQKVDEVISLMPENAVSAKNINKSTDLVVNRGDFKFYLKVLEIKSKKDIAPLSFIYEQAKLAILHQRKKELIAAKREAYYKEAFKSNKVKIYTN